jgi:hypothetical protein
MADLLLLKWINIKTPATAKTAAGVPPGKNGYIQKA